MGRVSLSTALRPFAPALSVLTEALGALEWRLGGSALLAALRLADEVGDLDVTVAADDLDAVRDGLAPWIVEVDLGDAPPPWCSDWIVRLDVDGVEVDMIGGFCIVTDTGRVAVPQEPGGHLDVDGSAVPLADPAVWWWVYHGYKPDKADLLAKVVPQARRQQLVRQLGPPARSQRPGTGR